VAYRAAKVVCDAGGAGASAGAGGGVGVRDGAVWVALGGRDADGCGFSAASAACLWSATSRAAWPSAVRELRSQAGVPVLLSLEVMEKGF
jgi:hypothetical protein